MCGQQSAGRPWYSLGSGTKGEKKGWIYSVKAKYHKIFLTTAYFARNKLYSSPSIKFPRSDYLVFGRKQQLMVHYCLRC